MRFVGSNLTEIVLADKDSPQLLSIAGERRSCLLGGPMEPQGSHRHQLIAQTLLRHDVGVLHILHDGTTCTAHADLFHGCP